MRRKHNQKLGASLKPKQPDPQTPFPGLIDGNIWQLRDQRPAFVMKKDGEYLMCVPMGDSPSDRRLRLHEQGHVAFESPWFDEDNPQPEGVEFATLNAVEDSRIGKLLGNVSPEYDEINRTAPILDSAMQAEYATAFKAQKEALEHSGKSSPHPVPLNLLEVARKYTASKGYYEEEFFRETAKENSFGWITKTVDKLFDRHIGSKSQPDFSDTVAFARELEDEIGKRQQQLVEQKAEENQLVEDADLDHLNRRYRFPSNKADWGKMTIKHPKLTERMPIGMRTYINRPASQGIIPTNWHRYATDMRIFNRRKTRENDSGTILIDQSGSMSLSIDEMQQIIARWPGVLIAGYSGYNDRQGELRILAKNGKMVSRSKLKPKGGLNIIDGPALNWLCKQKGPRIWISDGLVTGIGESQTKALLMDAAKLVKRGGIQRINDVREILGG